MNITLTASFQRDYKRCTSKEKELVHDVIAKLPFVLGKPHVHAGIGFRKLHASGIYEVRCGLGMRMVFVLAHKEVVLHRLGNHDTIQKYLKNM